MKCASFDGGLPSILISRAVSDALVEDLGTRGDITTLSTVSADAQAVAAFGARRAGVISGLDVARAAFEAFDGRVAFEALARDGDRVDAGAVVARVSGAARSLLTAERVALNYLCHMSGIATLTCRFVERIAGTNARIVDTRKTTPGLRAFEKYAVRCGGGHNHRSGLYDAILIKDNHIVAAGGVEAAIAAARAHAGHMVKIEVEVGSLEELEAALRHPLDAVLLDNMTSETLREAVRIVDGRITTEASGGVSLETVRAIAESGVDLISVGALTHSAPILDLGLDFSA
ncbi:nicotinate-nucleotide pyrophosphorylase [Hyphomicrobium nitrativorans NL23]|uniref:Probable nicotinate-nucleotide pyrophosphorylase [carboxylating] n=1 Tax=Hyphomicrobium nitrativorans NL23 TaxID=1029756 RepID=V5SC88_9HYPH|nr:carboxylating nicotinate-nucleotide diphosphorylase [Hyphomicrobium nitrativorans]AHB48143.1 nicotinate-nucleotide pyrophosphorylase [Hyphomicrobium nitrativorans NL23]